MYNGVYIQYIQLVKILCIYISLDLLLFKNYFVYILKVIGRDLYSHYYIYMLYI